MRILVAIGGNLPAVDGTPALAICQDAAASLDRLPGLRLRGLSRWYETAPIPPSGQPDYVNAVAHLTGEIDPAVLLAALQAIETRGHRVRSAPNAARTLDLDIIAMGDLVRPAPDPILPHPRAHERAFVLLPLLEVAPDWVHPVLGLPARDLLERIEGQRLRPIA